MDLSWLVMMIESDLTAWRNMYIRREAPLPKIIEIGCGPGALHGYLENRFGIDILGIDRNTWESDYVDVVGDFTDPILRKYCRIEPNSLNLILALSSLEHNPPEKHKEIVEICYDALKPGGVMISTIGTTPESSTNNRDMWNLSRDCLENIYHTEFVDDYPFDRIRKAWMEHHEMGERYCAEKIPWITVGAIIIKGSNSKSGDTGWLQQHKRKK